MRGAWTFRTACGCECFTVTIPPSSSAETGLGKKSQVLECGVVVVYTSNSSTLETETINLQVGVQPAQFYIARPNL